MPLIYWLKGEGQTAEAIDCLWLGGKGINKSIA